MRSPTAILILAAAIPWVADSSVSSADYGAAYPPAATGYEYAAPPGLDQIGEALDAIQSPERRSKVAEEWIEFSRNAITQNLELRREGLELQQRQIQHEQQIERLRLELVQMQERIEQLRTENLLLERENLQLRLQLQQSRQSPADRPRREPPSEQERPQPNPSEPAEQPPSERP